MAEEGYEYIIKREARLPIISADLMKLMLTLEGPGVEFYLKNYMRAMPLFEEVSDVLEQIGEHDIKVGKYLDGQRDRVFRGIENLRKNMKYVVDKIELYGGEK